MTISWAFVFTFVLSILGFRFLPSTGLFKRFILQSREEKNQGFQTKSLPVCICVGKIGKSKTVLRPSGRAVFDEQTIDVTTLGELIPKGETVIIAKIEGNNVFVDLQRS